jgi:hypothetical protein
MYQRLTIQLRKKEKTLRYPWPIAAVRSANDDIENCRHLRSRSSAVTDAYGCGSIELISYHDGRGPGGDGEDKGEDEEKRASAVAIGNSG